MILTIKPYNRLFVLILAFLLTGMGACGFQLRGTNLQALQNAAVYIQSSGANILAAEIKRQLLHADIKTAPGATDADYIIMVSNESFRSRVLSVSPATGKVEEYEVTYNAMLKIAGKNGSTMMTDTIPVTATRDYTFDEGAVLGKIEEESVLKMSIARQAAASVIRQLSAAVQ